MGQPVKIVDLAHQMIRLAGLEPDRDLKIQFTGARPGEKLSEEIHNEGNPLQPAGTESILFCRPAVLGRSELEKATNKIRHSCKVKDVQNAIDVLKDLIPEYRIASVVESRHEEKTTHSESTRRASLAAM